MSQHPTNIGGADIASPTCDDHMAGQNSAVRTQECDADFAFRFLTVNTAKPGELPHCRFLDLFEEGDADETFKSVARGLGIDLCLDRTDWDWSEDDALSVDDLAKCDPRKDLTDAGWTLADVCETDEGEILRIFVRSLRRRGAEPRAALTREGGVRCGTCSH